MHDDDNDRQQRREPMDEHGEALGPDRRQAAEILLPDHQAADQKHGDQHELRPINALLSGIVFAEFGHGFAIVHDQVGGAAQPANIVAIGRIDANERQGQQEKTYHEGHAEPGMERARRLLAAERPREEMQRGIGHGQAAHRQQDEQHRGGPMIQPLERRIARDQQPFPGFGA